MSEIGNRDELVKFSVTILNNLEKMIDEKVDMLDIQLYMGEALKAFAREYHRLILEKKISREEEYFNGVDEKSYHYQCNDCQKPYYYLKAVQNHMVKHHDYLWWDRRDICKRQDLNNPTGPILPQQLGEDL